MKQYYYLITSLKDLSVDLDRIPMELPEFIENVNSEVDGDDLQLFNALRLQFDNENIVNLLEKNDEPFVQHGLFSEEKLQEELSYPETLPDYLQTFINKVRDEEREFPDISLEDELSIHYYRYLMSLKNVMLNQYIDYDFKLKNVVSALNLKAHKLNPEKKILLLDELSENLINNNQEGFGLIHDYEWLQELLEIYSSGSMLDKERKLMEIRFQFVEKILEFEEFTINRILGYFIQLSLLLRWKELKEEAGLKVIEEITDKLSVDSKVFAESY